MKTIIALIAILLAGRLVVGCSSFGTRPDKNYKKAYISSGNFNKEKNIFVNRRPNLISEMKKNNLNWGLLKEWFSGGVDRVPAKALPEVRPDIEAFVNNKEGAKVIWFGHSTFLLNLNGVTVLVDPVFGDAASPVSWMVKRFQRPVLDLDELPEIDFILISHDHYDHLDMPTVKHFKDKKTVFITPLGVGSHLTGWGISKDRIVERDWWESISMGDTTFIATPAQHFSGRNGIYDNETLWASWVIKSKNHNIYFSGDSGYDVHFKEIGEKYGPFDMAFIESGQYNEKWKEVHMMPEDAIKAYEDLGAKKFFPVHWGMFELSFHTWYEPIVRVSKLSEQNGVNLVSPIIGEAVNIDEDYVSKSWWELE